VHTAIDFMSRLIHAGALPTALAAKLLPAVADLPLHDRMSRLEERGGPKPALSAVLSHAAVMSKSGLQRSQSEPAGGNPPMLVGPLPRSVTATGDARTIGISLHPQDGLQPYSQISVARAIAKRPGALSDIIPSEIDLKSQADYWRYVAGGLHIPAKLDAYAREAENAWKAAQHQVKSQSADSSLPQREHEQTSSGPAHGIQSW